MLFLFVFRNNIRIVLYQIKSHKLKGFSKLSKPLIIVFISNFKLKINMNKNLLVNFTVWNQAITEIFKDLSSENHDNNNTLLITGWVKIKYCQFQVYYWDGSREHLYNQYAQWIMLQTLPCVVYRELRSYRRLAGYQFEKLKM